MGDIALKVEGLTKEYRLGTIGYGTMREDLQTWWARLRGKEDPNSLVTASHHSESEQKHFLALDDISFEIKKGDRVGIIGRNGAGKSTLLKILSRITSPTKGNIYINGRVGSLLEVGTGFHQELTGRENIYLNGSILGMRRREIDKKLDEIVDFAGIEKFIDTPVKRYSSGMFVRLGFAVAAHLEPEILIVDEVLAVGDAEFQKKAIGKMEDVSNNEGRTILFVSHNMNSIKRLCTSGILLNNGQKEFSGEIEDVIMKYSFFNTNSYECDLLERKDRYGDGRIEIENIRIIDLNKKEISDVGCGHSFIIEFAYRMNQDYNNINGLIFSVKLTDELDQSVSLVHSRLTNDKLEVSNHNGHFLCKIENINLIPGNYNISYSIMQNDSYIDAIENAYLLRVSSSDFYVNNEYPPQVFGHHLLSASFYIEEGC